MSEVLWRRLEWFQRTRQCILSKRTSTKGPMTPPPHRFLFLFRPEVFLEKLLGGGFQPPAAKRLLTVTVQGGGPLVAWLLSASQLGSGFEGVAWAFKKYLLAGD